MKLLFLGGKRILGNNILRKIYRIKKLKIYVLNKNKISNKNKIPRIKYLLGDRKKKIKIFNLINKYKFDIIFDNNCYDYNDYKLIKKNLLRYKKTFYFFTSSIITYLNFSKTMSESDFFNKLKINKFIPKQLAFAKRKIEIDLIKKIKTNFCILRMHNIIGKNDHSNKTKFIKLIDQNYLERNGISGKALFQFAYIEDAANIIKKLITNLMRKKTLQKAYNIANDPISFENLISLKKKMYKKSYMLNKLNREVLENIIVSNSKIKNHLNIKLTPNKKIIKKIFSYR